MSKSCVVFVLVWLCGCGGGAEGTLTVDLTGRWSGSWTASGSSGTFEINLEHEQDRVTGTASAGIGGFQLVKDRKLEATVSGATLSGSVEGDFKMSFKLRLDDSETTLSGDFSASLQGMELRGEVEMKRAGE
jgi:hypothetical protein